MKTVILSVFALLLAFTGMSQTTDSLGNTQNPTMQRSTRSQNQHRKSWGDSTNRNKNNSMNRTRSYNSADSTMGNRRRPRNKNNMNRNMNNATLDADSTRQ